MDNIIIEPWQGIGEFKLGMTRNEVEECVQSYSTKYRVKSLDKNYFRFKIEYDSNNKVSFIEVNWDVKENFNCLFNGIDVFNTKVEILVKEIDKTSQYDRTHSELGCTYSFPELGLFLWRSREFTEEDRLEDWFLEMSPDNQEEELRFLYFETVSVVAPEYLALISDLEKNR